MENLFKLANVCYVIKHDINLDGETFELPENCYLFFNGGSIRDGKLIGKKATIIGCPIGSNVELEGDFGSFIRNIELPHYQFDWFEIGKQSFDYNANKPLWWNGHKWLNSLGFNAEHLTRGTSDERPVLSISDFGFQYFDKTIGKPIWWNGSKWVDNMGFSANLIKGTTVQRPTLINEDKGYTYYDTQLSKYICWNGTAWVNMDGTPLT